MVKRTPPALPAMSRVDEAPAVREPRQDAPKKAAPAATPKARADTTVSVDGGTASELRRLANVLGLREGRRVPIAEVVRRATALLSESITD